MAKRKDRIFDIVLSKACNTFGTHGGAVSAQKNIGEWMSSNWRGGKETTGRPKPQTRAESRRTAKLASTTSQLDTLPDLDESMIEFILTQKTSLGQEVISKAHQDIANTSQSG